MSHTEITNSKPLHNLVHQRNSQSLFIRSMVTFLTPSYTGTKRKSRFNDMFRWIPRGKRARLRVFSDGTPSGHCFRCSATRARRIDGVFPEFLIKT